VIRTVVVDDSEDLRFLMRMALSRDDRFEVVGEGANGEEALARVDSEDPDLLVLDLAMPIMDGLEVLARLHDRKRPPVVVLSGFANEAMKARSLELGAVAYITKGADIADVTDVLVAAVKARG
jgi:DNA-binding NarL/FixJ family response regulator